MNFIITGAPGTGKSTLIEEMRGRGYECYPEISRQLIREEMDKGGNKLPWEDLFGFSQEMVERMKEQLENLPSDRICLLDRGIPDPIAYLRKAGHPIPQAFWDEAKNGLYSRLAFIAPPWKEIFVNDAERPEAFEKALSLHRSLEETYEMLDFRLVELPRKTPSERADLLERCIEEALSQD